MNIQRPSCAVAIALIATQVLGPAVLWAADQRGIRVEETRRVLIAAISGEQLAVQSRGDTKALQFRDGVNAGDQITTGDRTVADVLIGNRAVVTLGQGTTAQFTTVSDEQTTILVSKGIVRVAASAAALGGQGSITIQTPTSQVQTRGGIVRVLVDQPAGAAEHTPLGEARPYRASYSPNTNTVIAALTPRSEIIQVEEGSAEIAGAGGKAVAVQAGQSVTMQSGQAGAISKFVNHGSMRAGVLATAGHSQTPKEGLDNLVALQVEQATALGTALTGAAETGKGEAGRKDHLKNVINGATGGVSLIGSLFGGPPPQNQERSGSGYSPYDSNGCCGYSDGPVTIRVNGRNELLVFTKTDPIETAWVDQSNPSCLESGCSLAILLDQKKVALQRAPSVTSNFTVSKELVLVGGATNTGHGGIAPTETLIVRQATPTNVAATSEVPGLKFDTYTGRVVGPYVFLDDIQNNYYYPFAKEFTAANTTFVVKDPPDTISGGRRGGTLGQFSNRLDRTVFINDGSSYVDAAITATGASVVLTGGVTLDQGTKATISTTDATINYFGSLPSTNTDAKFNGSLLAVIGGNSQKTSLTMQDRLLGVYDGSTITTDGGNKALLSVLDAKLKGPSSSIPLIDIAAGSHFSRKVGVTLDSDLDVVVTSAGSTPNVTVTSAVVTRSTIPLDGALLEASAPLFALTQATMTTTSHFADMAGNQAQSMRLGDSLVALSASQLTIQNGYLLNLNAATATVKGYLFSLNNGSTLTLNNGALFSLTNGSSLNLNGNAFGVFGSGANTLSIDNNLCTATCFQLVNSANQPILVNGETPLNVAGATENVVLPNNFNVFALAPGASASNAKIDIDANDALFRVDGTSTLTINGTTVVGQ